MFLGGSIFGLLGPKTAKWGRNPIIVVGFIAFSITYSAIYMNIPDNAPFGDTGAISFIDPPM